MLRVGSVHSVHRIANGNPFAHAHNEKVKTLLSDDCFQWCACAMLTQPDTNYVDANGII